LAAATSARTFCRSDYLRTAGSALAFREGGAPSTDFVRHRSPRHRRVEVGKTNSARLAAETFETGLAKTVRGHLENRRWCQAILDRGYEAERVGLSANAQQQTIAV
jgi:hypothetical protein